MSGFTTAALIARFFPGLVVDETNQQETTTTQINKRISKWYNEITAPPFGITYPASEPDPITNTYLLWQGLNTYLVAAPMFWPVGLRAELDVVKFSKAFEKLATDRLQQWKTHQLHFGIYRERRSDPLPTTALATVDDCITETDGFEPTSGIETDDYTPDQSNQPFTETIEWLISLETAIVRIYAAKYGYKQEDLNAVQTETYRELVAATVRPMVTAIHAIAKDRYAAVDGFVAHLLAEARKDHEKLATGFYKQLRRSS